ncbi:MAG: tetratricopeptide repeat protein [Ktedonobacterales bacterium]
MARNEQREQRPGAKGQTPTTPLTTEQQASLAGLMEQFPTLAQGLRAVAQDAQPGQDALERRASLAAPLAPVTDAAEPVAVAFAQRLGEQRGAHANDAIEVAQALGDLEARGAVAREARRARIRLRSAGAQASITIPPAPMVGRLAGATTEAATSTPTTAASPEATRDGHAVIPPPAPRKPQLVEAYATRTRESGELSLALAWQEGHDADLVRGYLFGLDFFQEGVKYCILTETMSKRSFMRETVEKMRTAEGAAAIKITWAQARRFVQEALAVNTWRGTEPSADFINHREQIDERLLAEPEDDEQRVAIAAEEQRVAREGDRPFMAPNMEAEETIANWIGAWSFGDFGMAYDLLANDNPARQQQSRDEYITLRHQWVAEAKPAALRLTMIREQERHASVLWTPSSAGAVGANARQEYEAFWSLALQDSPLGGQLDELPMGTLVSAESGRHWYWTAYTMQRDHSSSLWLVARQRDEGAVSQGLPLEELQKRITEAHTSVEQIAEKAPQDPRSKESLDAVRAVTAILTAAQHYGDALIARLPLDEETYQATLQDARALGAHERAVALLERMRGRFADETRIIFELGVEQYLTAEQYAQQGQNEAAAEWLGRSTATMTHVVEEDRTAQHLQGLGELLARQGHFTQAEARLHEAITLDSESAQLYTDLAEALMGQASGENLDTPAQPTEDERLALARQALDALREASKIDSNTPRLFTRMGAIYETLGQHDDAVLAFEEAIRHDPGDDAAFYTLGSLFLSHREPERARPLLETAVQIEPLSIQYHLSLAACYAALDRGREASRELDRIDQLQPGLPQVAELRTIIARQAQNPKKK